MEEQPERIYKDFQPPGASEAPKESKTLDRYLQGRVLILHHLFALISIMISILFPLVGVPLSLLALFGAIKLKTRVFVPLIGIITGVFILFMSPSNSEDSSESLVSEQVKKVQVTEEAKRDGAHEPSTDATFEEPAIEEVEAYASKIIEVYAPAEAGTWSALCEKRKSETYELFYSCILTPSTPGALMSVLELSYTSNGIHVVKVG